MKEGSPNFENSIKLQTQKFQKIKEKHRPYKGRLNFQVSSCIGEKPNMKVFECLDMETGGLMCAKLLKLELRYMHLTEILKKRVEIFKKRLIKPQNVVKYYDANYSTNDAGFYILIEFMSGNSIKDLLEITGGMFDEKITAIYTRQIIRGLQEIHT